MAEWKLGEAEYEKGKGGKRGDSALLDFSNEEERGKRKSCLHEPTSDVGQIMRTVGRKKKKKADFHVFFSREEGRSVDLMRRLM